MSGSQDRNSQCNAREIKSSLPRHELDRCRRAALRRLKIETLITTSLKRIALMSFEVDCRLSAHGSLNTFGRDEVSNNFLQLL